MAQQFPQLSERHIRFIAEQKIYFVATATADSRVNISPKGMDSFRVIESTRVVWLNVTGSGNETSAHVQVQPRMTIMFCAFEGPPQILRLYGTPKVIHTGEQQWDELYPLFNPLPGARQIFDLEIDLVQVSCGMGIPYYSYAGERESLSDWANKKGKDGLREYWEDRNQASIDGIPTHIVSRSS
jgi:hypothetical protein